MRHIFLFLLLIPAHIVQAQQSVKADRSSSSITYYMKHALHAWTGVSKDVNCVIQLNSEGHIEKVAATAKVKSFDSKNSNRDSHMLEVTDALSFPNVSFYSTSVTRQGIEFPRYRETVDHEGQGSRFR
jgi:polyisoprenoid-binding protein YceI